MDNDRLRELEQRIKGLEQQVRHLQDELSLDHRRQSIPSPKDEPDRVDKAGSSADRMQVLKRLEAGESWLNRVGMALLLLGIVFLFQYSIDRGWLIPPIRSAIGVGIGAGLLISGWKMDQAQSRMKQLLLGGAVGAFYITGFATYQLYDFAPPFLIWIFMIGVTALSFLLSVHQVKSVPAVVGALGGLGTPFMLYSGEGSLIALIIYSFLVLTGGLSVYMYRGWSSLLATLFVGSWLVWAVALVNNILGVAEVEAGHRWLLQGAVLFSYIALWAVPVWRYFRRWPEELDREPKSSAVGYSVILLLPIAALFISKQIWVLPASFWGAVTAIAALMYGGAARSAYVAEKRTLAGIHGYTGLILFALALFQLLSGPQLVAALALKAVLLQAAAFQTGKRPLSSGGHFLLGMTAVWLWFQLAGSSYNPSVPAEWAFWTELLVIVLAGLAVPLFLKKSSLRLLYRSAAHITLMVWLYYQFVPFVHGQVYATISWGVLGIGALLAAFVVDKNELKVLAMGTLFLVVAKLFLIDLEQMNPLLRILLFLGFGTVFLAAGYYIQRRWNPDSDLNE